MKIIAESASNHNGNFEYLTQLALASKKSNADFFTFQIFDSKSFCVSDYERFSIVDEICFTEEQWTTLIKTCNENYIDLLACALDIKSFDICYKNGLRFFKIHATDIINIPYLKHISNFDVKILLETQCATFQDISLCMSIVGDKVDAVLHGYSDYPTDIENLNLNSINYIKETFKTDIGFADHSLDTTEIPLMALAMGCKYLEKHITISRKDRHYDWQVSLYPEEFSLMTTKIAFYKKAMGYNGKHPNKSEKNFRPVLYKKVIENNTSLEMKRADVGEDYLTYKFNSFNKKDIGIGIIARLKSKRLKKKVLMPFHNGSLIEDLYNRIKKTDTVKTISVITSDLSEDEPLAEYCKLNNLNVFKGHAVSVIDRMLSFAYENQLGAVVRVTGDNPFSDPEILQEMISLFLKENLDYIKVNNAPIGVGVELYSTSYLWKLYLEMEDPLTSEYLAWIALNDKNSKKGCIDIISSNPNAAYYNFSVDYQEDYDRCKILLKNIGKENFTEIKLKDIFQSFKDISPADLNMSVKLPNHSNCTLEGFNQLINNAGYSKRVGFNID